MDEENEIPSKRKFHVDLKEVEDGIELIVTEEVEVKIARYSPEEIKEGDAFLRLEEGQYSDYLVFKRLLPLDDDEQALVQAVYAKTKDWTW